MGVMDDQRRAAQYRELLIETTPPKKRQKIHYVENRSTSEHFHSNSENVWRHRDFAWFQKT